jgi:hypothetical protein
MSNSMQPSINIAAKVPVLAGLVAILFIIDIGLISQLTSLVGGLSISEVFIITVVVVLSILVFILACIALFSHARIELAENGISQWRMTNRVFLRWDEIREIETRLGIRILKSPKDVIEIHLDDFKQPGELIDYIDSRVSPNIARN